MLPSNSHLLRHPAPWPCAALENPYGAERNGAKPFAVNEVPPTALYVSAPMRRNSRFIAFHLLEICLNIVVTAAFARDQIGRLRQPRHSLRIVLAPPEPARHANLEATSRDVLLRCPVLVFRPRRGKRPPT